MLLQGTEPFQLWNPAATTAARTLTLEHVKPFTAQGNWKYSHSDLPDGPVLPKNVVHLLGRDFVRQVPDVQDPVDLRREPDLMEEGQAVC